MRLRRFTLLAAAACIVAVPLRAQGPSSALAQGIRSYQDLDFEGAADAFRRLLNRSSVSTADRQQALGYLGASEYYLGHRDAAVSAFRESVTLDPRNRLDPLVFPPEVQRVYEEARRNVTVVSADVPRLTRFQLGQGQVPVQVYTSSYQDLAVGITGRSGQVVRWLYTGPIADSIAVGWDGRDALGNPFESGNYALRVTSRGAGTPGKTLEIPVSVTVEVQDTLPLPRPPLPSQFLPERSRTGLVQNAAKGIALGIAVLALPAVAGADSVQIGAPLLVGAAIGAAGLVALVGQPMGQPVPANIAHNKELRDAWQRRADSVSQENRRRRADVRLIVRTGEPVAQEASQ